MDDAELVEGGGEMAAVGESGLSVVRRVVESAGLAQAADCRTRLVSE
jgi:hypothetical protein